MLFAIAMTAGRLTGDAVTAGLRGRATLFWSGVVAVAGLIVLLTAPVRALVPLHSGFDRLPRPLRYA
jgi:hypothetical protein